MPGMPLEMWVRLPLKLGQQNLTRPIVTYTTIYGIVKRNEGFINVYSEPGQGTTFKIYLSRHKGKLDHQDETCLQEIIPGEGETILMVEDDQDILEMGTTMLEELGYKVLAAGSPTHALALGKEYAGKIELLLTDVILPEMNGRQLAQNLGMLCPVTLPILLPTEACWTRG